MQRFFIEPRLLQSPELDLPAPIVHQLVHVLRARVGEHVIFMDDTGWEYQAEITQISPRQVKATIQGKSPSTTEPRLRLVLYQALLREAKFDFVLQKGTELGVSAFVPFFCEHSVSIQPSPSKYERWGRIITEAAEQSGRARRPIIKQPISFKEACTMPPSRVLGLFASPCKAVSLGQALNEVVVDEIRLYIGPEGGFTQDEVQFAQQQGLIITHLGPRILRTETAGLAAMAAILYALGEF
ncbi:MAG: 16S rRNA (uracil(1498)-N(3))-methyltransferase [Anaerolineae bacterium]